MCVCFSLEEEPTKKKLKIKVTIIGDGSVGKTSLLQRFTQGTFQTDYIKTIGAQLTNYKTEVDGYKFELIFWDIAGQDDFHFLRPSFYRASKAAIIVYSLERNNLGERSFNHITRWYEDVKQFCGEIPIVVFANKVDLVDEQSLDKLQIQNLVKKLNIIGYYITSAKTGQGLDEAFNALIKEIHR
ncbi:MAG: GTP-binding protein [Candidatus Lokiarchaeota archaeon]|nr:GTP-binding protein [Candidatus Lokiarchaeota archaeon]